MTIASLCLFLQMLLENTSYTYNMSHSAISPAILYWGTPVVIVSTTNADGTPNLGPMSSAWWLGDRCMLGLDASSQTTINLLRTKQCVLNLPTDDMGHAVNALARTTGTEEVPPAKHMRGYRFEREKFRVAGLTEQESEYVTPPRVRECAVQMETELVGTYQMLRDLPGFIIACEVRVLRTWVTPELRLAGAENKIDTDRWKPMIMSFQHLYGLGQGMLLRSTLAGVEEESYRVPEEIYERKEKVDKVEREGGLL